MACNTPATPKNHSNPTPRVLSDRTISAKDAALAAESASIDLKPVAPLLMAVSHSIAAGDISTADELIKQARYWVDMTLNDLDLFREEIGGSV